MFFKMPVKMENLVVSCQKMENLIVSCHIQTPRTYCAANTEDTKLVISHIKGKYPEAPLVGVGVSLGGLVCLSCPWKQGRLIHCLLMA